MSILWGDPASASALAAVLRRTAARLADEGRAVQDDLGRAAPGWTGPRAIRTRRRVEWVATESAAVARALDEAGHRLQLLATELAALTARLHRLEEAARAEGWEVCDGAVRAAWGITGVADAGAAQEDAQRREELQQQVHTALTRLGRLRSTLAHDCEVASTRLRESTAALRGG